MTQPIQEPSVPRRLTSFGYGQNQLFRRPAPVAGGGIAVFRAYRFDTPLTIGGSGTSVNVLFDTWENCDTDVFDVNLAGGLVVSVDLLVEGRITIEWGVRFADDVSDSVAMFLVDSDPVWGPNQHMVIHSRKTNGTETFEETGIYIETFVRTYPTLDIFSSGSQFPQNFSFEVAQISGSAEDIDFAFLDISHEAADICTGPIES